MVTRAQVEWERKFEVTEGTEVPRLAGVGPVARHGEPVEHRLDATYFDTRDLRLAAAGITLRRRTGGGDEGWHLKLPVAAERREEITQPLGRAKYLVPDELATLVTARSLGGRLVPVAHIATVRSESDLLDADGGLLATVTDDHVTAEAIGEEAHLDAWRELEVEVGPGGDERVLDAVTKALLEAGAQPARNDSKLLRILGSRVRRERRAKPGHKSSAEEVVLYYLHEQVENLRAHDPGARRDVEDAVHQLRVATRRLRSALNTFRRVLDRSRTRELGEELKWLAGELALARDTEVLQERLNEQLDALPSGLVLGPVRDSLRTHFEQESVAGRALALDALNSERYTRLLRALEDLLADPPVTANAALDARWELRHAVRRAKRRLDKAIAAVDNNDADRDVALHEARKKAKQARYAADAVLPAFGERLKAWRGKVKSVQSTLGAHQDSVVAREALRELGVRADLAGHSSFTYGVLYRENVAEAERTEAAFRDQREELAHGMGPRWLVR